jgi:hypothetical protein
MLVIVFAVFPGMFMVVLSQIVGMRVGMFMGMNHITM